MKNKTIFITKNNQNIKQTITLTYTQKNTNIIINTKSNKPHPKLPNTIHNMTKKIQQTNNQTLPLILNIQDKKLVHQQINKATNHFDNINALINNTNTIKLTNIKNLKINQYNLIHQINTHTIFLYNQTTLP